MKVIPTEKVKEILEEVTKAYNILEDDLSGDLEWINKKIDEAKQILYDIPHPDDINSLEEEIKDE